MRTFVYIDGYNLYYGRLQGSAHKWLDVRALAQQLCEKQEPGSHVEQVRYFTAPIMARLATHGSRSVEAQNTYLRALKIHGVQVELGRHQLEHGYAPRYVPGVTPSRADRVPIWLLSEKETDVRMALAMYRDTACHRPDQLVLISGDTDLAPAMESLRADFPIRIGLVLPRKPDGRRPPPAQLPSLAHWTRPHILDEELALAQLPERAPTKRKPVSKPDYW